MTAKEKRIAQNRLARQVEKRMSATKLFKCGICQSRFDIRQSLEAHVEHGHGGEEELRLVDKVYQCGKCDANYESCNSLAYHVKKSHILIPGLEEKDPEPVQEPVSAAAIQFKCTLCDGKFSHESYLFSHMTTVHSKQDMDEETSDLEMITEEDETNEGSRLSEKIQKTRPQSAKEQQKVRQEKSIVPNTPPKVFSCNLCKMKFSSNIELKYHFENVHRYVPKHGVMSQRARKMFQCDHCNLSFDANIKLKKHFEKSHNHRRTSQSHQAGSSEQVRSFQSIEGKANDITHRSQSIVAKRSHVGKSLGSNKRRNKSDSDDESTMSFNPDSKNSSAESITEFDWAKKGESLREIRQSSRKANLTLNTPTKATSTTDLNPFACGLCNDSFKEASSLTQHVFLHHSS